MRELKFRVLDGRGNWIYYGTAVSCEISGMTFDCIEESECQFTGLHDKNGVEIYEGDIVRDSDGGVHEVKYYNELYWDGGGSNHPGFYLSGGFSGYGDDDFDMNYHVGFGGCEIIGNIHQNPELLP